MTLNLDTRVDGVRAFNRFYTKQIGVITDRLLDTPHTLPQARVLYELATAEEDLTASQLAGLLGLDPGYMSKLVNSLEKCGLIRRTRSKRDGRQRMLNLTAEGSSVFENLNGRSAAQVRAMLERLSDEDQGRLLKAMSAVEAILADRPGEGSPVVLRTHRPGDIGWIVQRQGIVYNEEYGWDETFEGLVAEIMAKLIKTFDHRKERIWIAEIDSERAGTVSLAASDRYTAQLRLFFVEPWARQRGVGGMLLAECIRFARQAGYKKIKLWTQDCLDAARHLYETQGFSLVSEENHTSFGHDLRGQMWELEL